MTNTCKLTAALVCLGLSSASLGADLGEINGTKFSIGGYIKVEGIFTDPDEESSSFDGSARQSRINFKATQNVEGHQLTAFLEGDLWGGFYTSTSANWRLRHAYVQVDNVTLGQTWGGQFWAIAPYDGELINFWGLGAGTIAGNGARVRPDVVLHYVRDGFRFTAQDPIYEDAEAPDLVVSYNKNLRGGSAVNVALTGREVQNSPDTGSGADSDFGFAISVATRIHLGKQGQLRLSAYSGEGVGVYSGICVGGAWITAGDANCDVENGDLVEQTGYALAYRHQFNPRLRGTVRFGKIMVDDIDNTTFETPSINLIYTYLPNLDLGVEWRDQNIDTLNIGPFAGSRAAGSQLEFMAQLKF